MAVFNTKYYQSQEDALYSDGDIEDEIYTRVCKRDETLGMDPRWAVFYHFSPQRENILNWYPFESNSTILEIGAGCGALTGLLIRRGKHVTSCELTMRRAKILFQRYVDADNLEVIVGNVLRVEFEKRFDYVIINGVLEYAGGIMGKDVENPYTQFLSYMKSLLKPEGKILLAIENQFGLKYINGAPEDHLGRVFAGINGYPGQNKIRTFSRKELSNLFECVGLDVLRWYYPYPDYKFPTEIFSDSTVDEVEPKTTDVPYDMPRIELFDKEIVRKALMENKIAGVFNNSFLVELGNKACQEMNGPDYVKISSNRKKKFAICTQIYQQKEIVEKRALYPDANKHLQRMETPIQDQGPICTVQSKYEDGILRYSLLHEQSLTSLLSEQAEQGQVDAFWDTLQILKTYLYRGDLSKQPVHPKFLEAFGPVEPQRQLHWTEKVNIDLNTDNFFCGPDQWTVIDNEWVFSCAVPGEYALWRVLQQLRDHALFRPIVTEAAVRDFLEVGEPELEVFEKWEHHFISEYVGMQDFASQQRAVYHIDLDESIKEEEAKQFLWSQLFLFDEAGHAEVLKSAAQNKDGTWCVEFQSDRIAQAKQIRWDPLEGNACSISDVRLEELSVRPINARSWDENKAVFSTYDPQFLVEGSTSNRACIKIQFKCEILDWTTGYFQIECERNAEREKRLNAERQCEAVQAENRQLLMRTETVEAHAAEIDQQLQEERTQAEETAQKLRLAQAQAEDSAQKLRLAQAQIAEKEQQLKETEQQLQQINSALEYLKGELCDHRWKSAAKILMKRKIEG